MDRTDRLPNREEVAPLLDNAVDRFNPFYLCRQQVPLDVGDDHSGHHSVVFDDDGSATRTLQSREGKIEDLGGFGLGVLTEVTGNHMALAEVRREVCPCW